MRNDRSRIRLLSKLINNFATSIANFAKQADSARMTLFRKIRYDFIKLTGSFTSSKLYRRLAFHAKVVEKNFKIASKEMYVGRCRLWEDAPKRAVGSCFMIDFTFLVESNCSR